MTIPPTSWTDNNLTWTAANPLWDLMSLNLAMIESIKECDSITGRSVPALLSATYNPIRPNRDYVNAIHPEVTALIPLFVNHLDHAGDWNGQTTIPNWTVATILTAIGDASRITPSNLLNLSPWYFQTYKILNMLRWAKKSILVSNYLDRSTPGGTLIGNLATAWASASWTSGGGAPHCAYASQDGYGAASRNAATYSINFSWDGGALTYDLYVICGLLHGYDTYNPEISPNANVFNRNLSDVSNTFAGLTEITQLGKIETLPANGGHDFYAWELTDVCFILKFDGANGRKFL